jgi:hypothetical protein
VLMIAFTVCWSVLASGATVALLAFFRPEQDIANWIARISGIMNTMIGLLAGFLAGRTDMAVQIQQQRRDDMAAAEEARGA